MDGDVAAHFAGDAAADGEAEAGAFVEGLAGDLDEGFENGFEMFGGDADAGVGDAEAEDSGRASGGEADGTGLGELDGVAEEIEEDLAEAFFVGDDGIGQGRIGQEREFDGLGAGAGSDHVGDALEEGEEAEFGGGDFEFAGLDFGDVEDVVDDGEEVFAALLDDGGALALFGGGGGVAAEELGVAEDGVEGGAEFVGHVGEEFGFGAGGGLGGEGGAAEFGGAVFDEFLEAVLVAAEFLGLVAEADVGFAAGAFLLPGHGEDEGEGAPEIDFGFGEEGDEGGGDVDEAGEGEDDEAGGDDAEIAFAAQDADDGGMEADEGLEAEGDEDDPLAAFGEGEPAEEVRGPEDGGDEELELPAAADEAIPAGAEGLLDEEPEADGEEEERDDVDVEEPLRTIREHVHDVAGAQFGEAEKDGHEGEPGGEGDAVAAADEEGKESIEADDEEKIAEGAAAPFVADEVAHEQGLGGEEDDGFGGRQAFGLGGEEEDVEQLAGGVAGEGDEMEAAGGSAGDPLLRFERAILVEAIAVEEDGEGIALEVGEEERFVGVGDVGEDAAEPEAGFAVGIGGGVLPIPRGPGDGEVGAGGETFEGIGDEIAVGVGPAVLEADDEVGPLVGVVFRADAEGGEGLGFGGRNGRRVGARGGEGKRGEEKGGERERGRPAGPGIHGAKGLHGIRERARMNQIPGRGESFWS